MRRKLLLSVSVIALIAVVSSLAISVYAPASGNTEPMVAYSFKVEIDGVTEANFMEVEGLNVTVETIEYREGDDDIVMLIPGEVHYGPLVLKNGKTSSDLLLDWLMETVDGTMSRKALSIIVENKAGLEVARYNCYEAWPSSWSLGKLDSMNGEVLFEQIVIQYEKLEIAD